MEKPEIPEYLFEQWQQTIELGAEIISVPTACLIGLEPGYLSVLATNVSVNNPYRRGEKFGFSNDDFFSAAGDSGHYIRIEELLTAGSGPGKIFIKDGIVALAGFPVFWPDGDLFCLVCAMDTKPRDYASAHIGLLREFKRAIEADLNVIYATIEYESAKGSLELERRQLFSIFESIDEPIYVCDPDTYQILYANAMVKRMFGLDVLGKVCYQVLQGLEFPCFFCAHKFIFNTGQDTYVSEFRNRFNRRWYQTVDKAIRWVDGRNVHCRIAFDITERKKLEIELIEAHNMIRAVFDAIREDIVVVDIDYLVTEVNDNFLKHLGYTDRSQVIGRKCHDVIKKKDEKCPECVVAKVFDSGKPAHVICPDETGCRIFENDAYPFLNGEGVLTDVVKLTRDITSQVKNEELLREERDNARKFFDISGVAMIVIGADRKVIQINRVGCDILGYLEEEVVGKDWFDTFVPLNVRQATVSVFEKLVAGEIEPAEFFENTVLNKIGQERLFAWHNTVLEDANGKIWGTLSSGEDITDRRQMENELRESRKKFKTLFELAPDAVFLEDINGKIIDCNIAAERMLGYSRQEFLSMSAQDLVPDYLRDALPEIMRIFSEKGEYFGEAANQRKNGEILPVDVSIKLMELEGQKRIFVIVKDITERKKAQAELMQAHKLASTGQLAAGVAHEINNPLSALSGELQWLMESHKKDKELSKSLKFMDRVAGRISRIVNNLLTFSREISLTSRLQCDVNALVRKVLQLVDRRIRNMKIKVKKNFADNIPDIYANPGELEQAFMNIILNAVDAMPDGGDLSLVTRLSRDHKSIEIIFTDTGVGVSADNLPRVFDPFFTTKPPDKGTGLGLSITHGIIKEYGGTIELKSDVNQGTIVAIRLPIAEKAV